MNTPALCARLMKLAYGELSLKDVNPLGMTWVDKVECGASIVFLTGDGYRVFIIPRGTDDLMDAKWDMKFIKTDFPGGGRVHRGFYAAFSAIWEPLEAKMSYLDPRLPILATGHSLGGAMVQMIAAILGDRLSEAHVFGCPRVGNKDFVARITCPGTLWEAHMDPVTGVPFRWGPIQAISAIAMGRAPTMFLQPSAWDIRTINSWGHSSSGYDKAMSAR